MGTTFREALSPVALRFRPSVRDIEVLRVAAHLDGEDFLASAARARDAVLRWAQRRGGSMLPAEAWAHQDFDVLTGGRLRAGVRIVTESIDFWALRAEDPDTAVPGRTWTTEIVIGGEAGRRAQFSLRLTVSTVEEAVPILPYVPGPVLQIVDAPGLIRGGRTLRSWPLTVSSQNGAHDLCDLLADPLRRLPVFAVGVPDSPSAGPLVDDVAIARATAGLARVYRIPRRFCWVLTDRFGKRRSVFENAVRVYLPGFSETDDPFRHRLFLGAALQRPDQAADCAAWLRRIAADLSVSSSTRLGGEVVDFAAVRTASRRIRASSLAHSNAPDAELLATARDLIESLERQVADKDAEITAMVDLVEAAEARAALAEQESRSLIFKIRQIQEVHARGNAPLTAEPPLPMEWKDFLDWVDLTYPDRIALTPAARRLVREPEFEDVAQVARAIAWLATVQHERRLEGGGSLRDERVENGVINAFCGSDVYPADWRGRRYDVDQHIKSSSNTRDPRRCLRIYYFWEPDAQITVIDHLPSHRRTSAS